NWDKPFLLKIHYLRNMDGKAISKHTVKEISYQHPQQVKANYKEYRDTFNQLIPDVQNGTNLYGYMDENGKGYIYSDNGLIGEIRDKELSKYFFEIWLSDNSSYQNLSKQLRGL
ncbi:hypothetical protein AB4F11_08065, partial [Francisella philomiragia]